MTAQVLVHPSAGANADETVRRSIKALVAGRGIDKDELARAIGMKRATLYRRLAGTGSTQAFSAGEVALIAAYLGVPVTEIFSGLGGVMVVPEPQIDSAQSRPPSETATDGDELSQRRRRREDRRRRDEKRWLTPPIIRPHLQLVTWTA